MKYIKFLIAITLLSCAMGLHSYASLEPCENKKTKDRCDMASGGGPNVKCGWDSKSKKCVLAKNIKKKFVEAEASLE